MYLSDRDIRRLLPDLAIETPNDAYPFDADEQIQPCSIDLRVSDVFWKPSRRLRCWHRLAPSRTPTVDLRHVKMHELDPRRDWKRKQLSEGETLTIKQDRGAKQLRPARLVRSLHGRLRQSRLGRVHAALQLFNAGPYPIRLTPYLSVCQLKLVQLSSPPERSYGDPELQNKYVNDDGGPSVWWRDSRVKALQKRLGEIDVAERMQRDIVERVRFENAEILDRFERFVRSRRLGTLENADSLLDGFAVREGWRKKGDRLSVGATTVLFGATVGSVFVHPVSGWHVVVWLLTVAAAVAGARGFARSESGYLTKAALTRAPDAEGRPTTAP